MKDVVLKFPPFEKIKELPLLEYDEDWGDYFPAEYEFSLFNIYYGLYCRIKYNEDGEGKLILDVMKDGYIYDEYHFNATEEDYEDLKEEARSIYNDTMRMLTTSNDSFSHCWFDNSNR